MRGSSHNGPDYQCLTKCLFVTGSTESGRFDAVPGQEALLRRVHVQEMQEEMDVRQQLGKPWPGLHQVSTERLPS